MEKHTLIGVLVKEIGFDVKTKGNTLRVSGGIGSRQSRLAYLSRFFNSPILKDKPRISSLGYVKVGDCNLVVKDNKPSSTHYEEEVCKYLNETFLQYNITDVLVGNRRYSCFDSLAKKIPGTPKADIQWGEIFISHKAAGGFQQYSGITEAAGENIHWHKETQWFLNEVTKYIKDGKLIYPIITNVWDPNLIRHSIYGPEADALKPFGPNHVTCVGQGDPILTPENGSLRLTFSEGIHTDRSITHFFGDLKPVFAATFRTGRGFNYQGKRYDGARVGIYPYGEMKGRTNLLELESPFW